MAMACYPAGDKQEGLKWYTGALQADKDRQPILFYEIGVLGYRQLHAQAESVLGPEEENN